MIVVDDTSRDAWCRLAQAVWRHLEPYHALVYFAPEHRAACDEAGLRGGWMAYFASRSAPLGRASAELVTALFYNFHPAMVARAIPDAWSYAAPAEIVAVRLRAMDEALERVLGDLIGAEELRRCAQLALAVTAADADLAGRPMFAANLALDCPDSSHLALWHAATLLREHRGDGHIIALSAAEIDGCQAHVLQAAAGVAPRGQLQPNRGWSDEDWQVATDVLVRRGWLSADARITEAGYAARAEIGAHTDWLACAPLRRAGEDVVRQLLVAMPPILQRLRSAGDIPYPNPMGLPADAATTQQALTSQLGGRA